LIAPRCISVHSVCINPIVPGNTKISAVNETHGRRDKRLRRRLRFAPEQPLETSMSATLATIVWPEVAKRANAFAQIFSACWDGIARHFVCRAAITTLCELDDRALRDIGIGRSQIEAAVHGFITLPGQART
jgi:uncharacterized protein YjiS (DUF1127 family)